MVGANKQTLWRGELVARTAIAYPVVVEEPPPPPSPLGEVVALVASTLPAFGLESQPTTDASWLSNVLQACSNLDFSPFFSENLRTHLRTCSRSYIYVFVCHDQNEINFSDVVILYFAEYAKIYFQNTTIGNHQQWKPYI